ncbi:jg6305 [Pararge aegeria aegeria]|uniref:Jg6305 protein n=1 Tax=Pararge aegeria aegeria TaxID=348720 RepID=A0A8S4QYQ5_9NEOP|nr:jg6305 [Pararge aegeria aegeria]
MYGPPGTAEDIFNIIYFRFTFDERIEILTYPPISPDYIRKLFTNIKIPILTIIADASNKSGKYKETPFLFDEKAFPNNNHRLREVFGNHDLHVIHPERVASFVAQFLLYGINGLDNKAKL